MGEGNEAPPLSFYICICVHIIYVHVFINIYMDIFNSLIWTLTSRFYVLLFIISELCDT